MIDFVTLKRPATPNTYLVAPEGFCQAAKPDRIAPAFPFPAESLRAAFRAVALGDERVVLRESDDAASQDAFVQRSLLFRFADDIDARFVPLPQGGSTLAVYSRSRVGRSDFGVNRARVERWLARLTP